VADLKVRRTRRLHRIELASTHLGTGAALFTHTNSTLQKSDVITKLLPRPWNLSLHLHLIAFLHISSASPYLFCTPHHVDIYFHTTTCTPRTLTTPLFPRCIFAAKQISFFGKIAPICRCFLLMNIKSLLESPSLTCPLAVARILPVHHQVVSPYPTPKNYLRKFTHTHID
jgi:hypothetical protein